MKKLSVLALVISIVALLISAWVWTDGFGGGATFVATRVTSNDITGGGKGTGTSGQTATQTGGLQVESGKTFIVTVVNSGNNDKLFDVSVSPVVYMSGDQKYLVALNVNSVQAFAPAQGLLTSLQTARQKMLPIMTTSAFSSYLSSIDSAAAVNVNLAALKQEWQGKVLAPLSVANGYQAFTLTEKGNPTSDILSLPIIVSGTTQFTNATTITDNNVMADFWRRAPSIMSIPQ
jgi:hypothetical protein